ncbi:hypothetical protein [Listeria ilorinensis]|uniref:hypothetical protein n=1 Tax=Listeria ilorinensis TaxID=2867439 RepID=UPI001EF606F8|nr:hypothetical protein [Listeria ilorinensis]
MQETEETYLHKTTRYVTMTLAVISILQGLLAIIGLVAVNSMRNEIVAKLSEADFQKMILNSGLNTVAFLAIGGWLLLTFFKLKKDEKIIGIVYLVYIAYILFSVVMMFVKQTAQVGNLVIPFALIVFAALSFFSVRKMKKEG